MFKKSIIILLCLASLCLMCACGGSEPSSTVRSDVPASDISAAVEAAISSEGLIQVDESYILGRMQIDTAKCSDYVVKITSIGTAIDEYGIFRAADEASAKEVTEQVKAYFERYLASWMDEYRPEEKPKLQAAEVHTEGVYVFYTIMGEADADAALAALNSLIK
ncbi:MAG: DUF4358 domain-containing protein [Oscillospiraceae bacterium]|nr:DUF4358 domain-containing protein [Oscillospiraceae bacterium]